MIIDTHCHIYKSEMENPEEIINKALENDIQLIVNGTDPSSNREVLDLADEYENVHAALGYLYSYADEVSEADISLLDSQLGCDNVVAVGEIGLDYYHTKDNRVKQIDLFEEMLDLSKKHNLPVIVHSRKSIQDTYDILKKHKVNGSLHCYQGSAEMAQEFVKLGFYIGIAGPVTYSGNKKVKKVLKSTDINRILIETDSPYLTPLEKRGEKNTPFNLKYIIGKISDELEINPDEIAEITACNARRLFDI